jgi:hypothetical protein
MKVMDRGSFWISSVWGIIFGGFAIALFSLWIAPRFLYRNPAYTAFESLQDQYDVWRRHNEVKLAQATIERSLAGIPLNNVMLEGNHNLIANGLLSLRNAKTKSMVLATLFSRSENDDLGIALEWHFLCVDRVCGYVEPLAFLNDTKKTARILNGDVSALTPGLPVEMPASYKKLCDTPVPVETLPKPTWLGVANWLVFSGAFALMFFIVGLIGYVSDHDNGKKLGNWSHPFRSFPDFPLSWLMIVAVLPGYVAGMVFYWGGCLLTVNLGATFATMNRSFSVARSFNDEYSLVEKNLAKLREKALKAGAGDLLARIDNEMKRIKENRNRAQLAKISGSLDDLVALIDAVDEVGGVTTV